MNVAFLGLLALLALLAALAVVGIVLLVLGVARRSSEGRQAAVPREAEPGP